MVQQQPKPKQRLTVVVVEPGQRPPEDSKDATAIEIGGAFHRVLAVGVREGRRRHP